MKQNIGLSIEKWLINLGINYEISEVLSVIIILALIVIVGIVSDVLTKRVLLTVLKKFIRKTKTEWDDILLEKKLFRRVAHLAPAIIVYYTIEFAFPDVEFLTNIIEKAAQIYMIAITIMVINSFLNGVNEIYEKTTGEDRGTSIKSYVQVLKIITFSILAIGIISILFDLELGKIIASIGAVAAVLLLIFKDSILGLVAGVQLAANDMARLGDWISMPSNNADGPVIEITLHTVKVQNWDKTITTIPTYSLVSDSFINWRGMEESDGRRMMKSLNIDINSIHFCSDEEIEEFKKYEGVSNIIEDINESGESLTNIAIFRYYLWDHIKNRKDVNDNMICMVRYNDPGNKGLPLQFYAFSKIQTWVEYEQVQAKIIDFAYSAMHRLNLKPFQDASGNDLRSLKINY